MTTVLILLTASVAVLLSLAPVGVGPESWLGPHLLLITFGFWCARRPEAVPSLGVFALGLAHDLWRAGPVGAETFALLICVELARLISDRSPARSFALEWLRFAGIAALFEAILQVLFAITLTPSPELAVIAERYAMSLVFYAPIAYALVKITRVTRRPASLY